MHYKLTDETITLANGIKLFRIQATKDLPMHGVEKDDLGGYVQSTSNLDGNAWVSDNACVFVNARVCDDAHVCDNARVFGNAIVHGNACVSNNASVYGNACVGGNVHIKHNKYIFLKDVKLETQLDVSLAIMRRPEWKIEWKRKCD